MKRKGKTRRQRKQRAGGTRQMAARIFIDPQGQERVNIFQEFTDEHFLELLRQVGIYFDGFTSGENRFIISYPTEAENHNLDHPDLIFRHVRTSPGGQVEEINFPSTLPYHLQQGVVSIDVFGVRYFLHFSHSHEQNLNSSFIEI